MKQQTRPSKKLFWSGLVLTILYLLVSVFIVCRNWSAMLTMSPNEWGDFLTGIFGPMAFLWLVLGYFQQGEELRFSAEALWLQSEELKNSVEQQRALVEATRSQIDFEKLTIEEQRLQDSHRAQPIFKVIYGGKSKNGSVYLHTIHANNFGKTCTNASVFGNDKEICRSGVVSPGSGMNASIATSTVDLENGTTVRVEYLDANGDPGELHFVFQDGEFRPD